MLAFAVGLAGCGGNGEEEAAAAADDPPPPAPAERPAPQPTGCPRVSILSDAAQMVVFRPGPGRDLTDVALRGVIAGFDGGCEYFDGYVQVAMRLSLAAEQGPAATGDTAGFDYFIAIADPEGRVLSKEVFDTEVRFPPGGDQGGTVETLDYRIPLEEPAAGRFYRVLVGFQLTPAQLEYNRGSP
ncbi:MAG: hypothetical protein GVY13_17420 [Alphaproteobacteria bacterium]|nr:hypothetical protein [Alphaproteobacteria bacterium]